MQSKTATREIAAPVISSYGQILKSSATVGGSMALILSIGVVRTKIIAVLLGPGGFGIFGLYASLASLAVCIAGLGINSSGVRQIAYAVGSGDAGQIARTSIALRRISILLGLFGVALLIAFSRPVSRVTFGGGQNENAICLLSAAVFFQLVSEGQSALIQGMRHILDLAKSRVFGALFGSFLSVALIFFLRDRGVVPSLVVSALIALAVSWWYSQKVKLQSATMSFSEMRHEVSGLLKLGLVFMASTLAVLGSAYLVRIIVLRKLGYEATGFYQSAWTIGGMYVGFILEAMGADFYPRLSAASDDSEQCSRLVNEQVQVGLLLAVPGVIAALTFAPLIIVFFYSAKFKAAVHILRWMCLGTVLQVITWPLSYLIAAKKRQAIFLFCELAFSVASVGLAWLFVQRLGLEGTGIAFLAATIFYGLILSAIVYRISGFRWTALTSKIALSVLAMVTVTLGGFYVMPQIWAIGLGILLGILSAVYSTRMLSRLVAWQSIPASVRRLLNLLRMVPETREVNR